MRQLLTSLSLAAVVVVLPAVANAQGLQEFVVKLGGFLNGLIGVFIALAIVVFFWGLIRWLWGISTEDTHQGLQIMFWGIVAIFVMVTVWGLVRFLGTSLGVEDNRSIPPPQVQIQQ